MLSLSISRQNIHPVSNGGVSSCHGPSGRLLSTTHPASGAQPISLEGADTFDALELDLGVHLLQGGAVLLALLYLCLRQRLHIHCDACISACVPTEEKHQIDDFHELGLTALLVALPRLRSPAHVASDASGH